LTERVVALCAALIIGLLPVAWVSAAVAASLPPAERAGPFFPADATPEMAVLAGRSHEFDLTDMPPRPSREPAEAASRSTRSSTTRPAGRPTPAPEPPAPEPPVVSGIASNYPGTAGFAGQATVALPGAMGGRYTGDVQGHVTVCADRCVRLPVVDWCQCYWGSGDQRVADISHAAWPLITDRPLSAGLVEVRVILDDPKLAAVWNGG
jgi:hypothetical protein